MIGVMPRKVKVLTDIIGSFKMGFVLYAVVAVVVFLVLDWKSRQEGQHRDEVIIGFNIAFGAFWFFAVPIFALQWVLSKLSDMLFGKAKDEV